MTIDFTKYDKQELLSEFEEFLNHKYAKSVDPLTIPVSIFSQKLSPFETVVKYLAESGNFGYSEIGRILKKDRQVIWTTYKRAKKKYPGAFKKSPVSLTVPVSKLTSSKYSISEQIVSYLKEHHHMTITQIANVMKRDTRTIWTLYNRFVRKKKNG